METFLSAVHERPQAQEIAKNLVNTYAGVGRILGREVDDLKVIEVVTDSAVTMIMCVKETLERVLREKLKVEPIMDNLQGLVEYLNVSIGHSERECVKILYLNKRRQLIGEELYIGEMEKAPVYIKEITRKALIKNATSIIMSQKQLDENRKRARMQREGGKKKYLLQGLVVCQNCGYAYSGAQCGVEGKKFSYYRCSSTIRITDGREKCTNKLVRTDMLETAIWEKVKNLLKTQR